MKYFSSLILCMISIMSFSQSLIDKWSASYSNPNGPGAVTVEDAIMDSNGNSYVLLTVFTGGDYDAILVKFDSDGNKDWETSYSTSFGDSEEYGVRLQLDPSDNVYALININPDDYLNGSVPNGYAVRKYNSFGGLIANYENVNNGAAKYGGLANDLLYYDHTIDYVYVSYSRNSSAPVNVFSHLQRLNTSLVHQFGASYNPTTSAEHAGKIIGLGSGIYYLVRTGTSVSVIGYVYSFSNSTLITEESRSISKTVDDFLFIGGNSSVFTITKNTDGTNTFVRLSETTSDSHITFSSSYTINSVIYDAELMYITGSKSVSGHEELMLLRYGTDLVQDYESLLDVNHGSLSSVGYDLHLNDNNEIDIGGTVIDGGAVYTGSATFNRVTGVQQEISPYSTAASFDPQALLKGSDDVNVLVASTGSGIRLYSQCSVPVVDLGPDVSETYDPSGNSITLDAGSGFSSYSWSTGATTQTISVSTGGTYSVTVINASGCTGSDEMNYTINPADQTITWSQTIPGQTYRNSNYTLIATVSSNLDITFTSSDNDIAEPVLNGSDWELDIKIPGTITLTATQAGNENYNEATPVSKPVEVDYLDYYWVGGTGIYGKPNNTNLGTNWVTTSGGSTPHDVYPDKYCNVYFDSNSFTGADQAVRSPANSILECNDFTAATVTNNPSFEMEKFEVYGSFTLGSASYLINFLYFKAEETEFINFQGAEIYDQFESLLIYFRGTGTYNIVGDLINKDGTISIESGTLEIKSGYTITTTQPIDLDQGATLINSGSLIFESGATFFDEVGSSFSGNDFVFKRNTTFDETTGKYSIVGSPVSGTSTSSLGSLVYKYNESLDYLGNDGANRFVEVTTPEIMLSGTGYFSAYTGEIVVQGTPTTGTVSIPLDYTSSGGSEADYDGFNLVSNPYPSRIQVLPLSTYTGFLEENGPNGTGAIAGSIYLWRDEGSDGGRRSNADYMIVNSLGEVSGNAASSTSAYQGYISTFQGFFVQATGPGKAISFTQSMRRPGLTSPDGRFYREEIEEIFKIRVGVESEKDYSELLIGFPSDALKGKDLLYDALRLSANGLDISSQIDGQNYAIQGRPLGNDIDIIPLFFRAESTGIHQMEITTKAVPDGLEIVLIDKYLIDIIPVADNFVYSFNSVEGSFSDRFEIVVSSSVITGLLEEHNSMIRYEMEDETLYAKCKTPIQSIAIYDLQGKILLESVFGLPSREIQLPFHNGNKVLIIKAYLENGTVSSQKLQIK